MPRGWPPWGRRRHSSQSSCWSQLPPELLREVLVKIESEGWWPTYRDVVACAGIYQGWRGIMKEEVLHVPEASRKLMFPISLKQPGPKDGTIKCFIRRNQTTQTYSLYIGVTEDGAKPSMKGRVAISFATKWKTGKKLGVGMKSLE